MALGTEEGGVFVNTKSGVGSILKTISIIFGILGFIGGILLGVSAGSAEAVARNILYSESSGSFSFPTALIVWLVSGTFSALIYAIGEIVDQLTSIRSTLELVSSSLAQEASTKAPSATSVPSPAPLKAAADFVAQAQPAASAQAEGSASVPSSQSDSKWTYCKKCGDQATTYYARIRKECPTCGTPYEL
jgi:ribosomal protein L37E